MKSKNNLIKASHHNIKYTNIGKINRLVDFLIEFNRVTQFYVDYFCLYINLTVTCGNQIINQ